MKVPLQIQDNLTSPNFYDRVIAIAAEWATSCTCADVNAPWECSECTTNMVRAIRRAYAECNHYFEGVVNTAEMRPMRQTVLSPIPCIHCNLPLSRHAPALHSGPSRRSCPDGYGWHDHNVFCPGLGFSNPKPCVHKFGQTTCGYTESEHTDRFTHQYEAPDQEPTEADYAAHQAECDKDAENTCPDCNHKRDKPSDTCPMCDRPTILKQCPFCQASPVESPHWRRHYGCPTESCAAFAANLPAIEWNTRCENLTLTIEDWLKDHQ